jgi:hypothetical protein
MNKLVLNFFIIQGSWSRMSQLIALSLVIEVLSTLLKPVKAQLMNSEISELQEEGKQLLA